jgi:hypothetical protein
MKQKRGEQVSATLGSDIIKRITKDAKAEKRSFSSQLNFIANSYYVAKDCIDSKK